MKRICVFVQAILFCTIALSQHPHSRGGNPLYWGLVGGLSAGMLYVFYLLLGLFVNLIKGLKRGDFNISGKIHSLFTKIDNENKTRSNLNVDREQLHEVKNEENDHDAALCKQCGKQISAVDLYCSYCGTSLNRTSSTIIKLSQKFKDLSFLNTLIRGLVRFILELVLFALLGGIFSLICYRIGIKSDYDQVVCIFAPPTAYALYRLFHYAYKLNHKKKLLIITFFVLLVLSLWGIVLADNIRQAQRLKEMTRVNRTFLGCTFGDNSKEVLETLRKYVPDQLLPSMMISISDGPLEQIDKIWIENIQYGNYTLKTISFKFYRDKLYKVIMDVQTSKNENHSNLWTYENLSEMLGKKYKRDLSAKKYNNVENYCDNHTSVKLWHTPKMEEYKVMITYYDKDSGYNEYQEEGF